MDYNRAGIPLLEIVSEPDMRTGQEAAAYGAELRRIMVYLGISDCNMSVRVVELIAPSAAWPVSGLRWPGVCASDCCY